MTNLEILIGDSSISVQAEAGENLLQVLRRENLFVTADCNGNGTCGKCKVKISDDNRRTFYEVFSCRTEVFDGMVVKVDELSNLVSAETRSDNTTSSLAINSSYFSSILHSEQNMAFVAYGIAVDLGTTTIAANLIRLSDGELLASCQGWNQQIPYGADVISRVHYIMQNPEGLLQLSDIVQKQIQEMSLRLLEDASIPSSDSVKVYIAGNTIMQHIYAGIDPSSMAAAPYTPTTLFGEEFSQSNKVALTPCISAFIGGDITAGLYDTDLYKKEGNWLFLDIGTNGEMAFGGKDGLLCASVATGPAFEGAQIECGCYGRPGAISHVNWDKFSQKLTTEVISGEEASVNGICGSGLVDFLAVFTELGLITLDGRILSPFELEEFMEDGLIDEETISALENQLGLDFLQEDSDGNGVLYLNSVPPVYVCTKDIRNLQLAKASVRAGVEILLNQKKLTTDQLDGIILAGGFGSHLNPENLGKIGMLPTGSAKKLVQAGNTSLSGTRKVLIQASQNKTVDLISIPSKCHYLELADNKMFAEAFIKYLSLS